MTNQSNLLREAYPSDMTDAEWALIADMSPAPIWIPNLQQSMYHPRELMNAIRYRTRTGCSWRQLPHDFPPWESVFQWYKRWSREGVLEKIHDSLRRLVRIAAGRNAEPTAAIIDSQSVKTTDVGGPKGYDAGKKSMGESAICWWSYSLRTSHASASAPPVRGKDQPDALRIFHFPGQPISSHVYRGRYAGQSLSIGYRL